ncbi:MAG TPA: chemotaxis protein CheA [Xanthobacteraceae bacterium]|nr:chemotaxis protein CheA [Xanthobacteraceae bacterium]
MKAADPKEIFQQEAQDLLVQLEQALLDLEHAPADGALIDTAFRALHTIKGSGSMFGFEAVAAFTHHVENAFDKVRQGAIAPNRELIMITLHARDHMRQLIENPEAADSSAGQAILAELQRIMEAGAAPVAATPAGPASYRVRIAFPRDVMATGTNPLLLLDELRGLGRATVVALTDDVPPLDVIDPTACHVGWEVMLSTAQPPTAIEDVFLFVRDEMTLEIEPIRDTTPETPLGEILSQRGDVTSQAVEAALHEQKRVGELLVEAGAVSPDKVNAALAEQQHVRRDGAPKPSTNSSVRVPAERLGELMDQVGELVIAQSRLRQIATVSADQQVKSVAEEIERLVLELRDTTMSIRMVPIGALFGRFRRVVHDLSRDLGKEVALTMEGEETELDKTVIEQLNDPLVHLIRNAIDHGLEDPAGRAAAGKPQLGHIKLAARHAGMEVLISIQDDGRGMNRERIRARAEERGLLAKGAAVSDGELLQMIFQPGFSTAAQVTSLSGRGVGMDVVKRTIEGLRGAIDLQSTPGHGSEVTLRLPLTLAIIDGLLVRVGNGRYVLPLGAVEECVELSAQEDARSRGRSFLNIRGDLVPYLRLRELFACQTPADPYQKVVIVSSGDLKVGLVVDQVIGDHQTVIKSLSKLHADVEMLSGATILGDGAVALILDIPHLVEFGQVREENQRAAG